MKTILHSLLVLATFTAGAFAAEPKPMNASSDKPAATERITYGGGCFWCIEAVFQRLKGVKSVVSGYAGGHVDNPTYKQVSTGTTGHAEVVQLEYNPAEVSFGTLMEVFWAAHDPTTLNRQGADVGPHYRSAVFFENDAQKAAVEKSMKAAQADFKDPIVTEVAPLKKFYKGEDYHQNYFNQTGDRNPYCTAVIRPKLTKLLQKGLIREEPYLK